MLPLYGQTTKSQRKGRELRAEGSTADECAQSNGQPAADAHHPSRRLEMPIGTPLTQILPE